MIKVENLGRDYTNGEHKLTVLDGVNLEVASGEFIAITGPSGSGKSTLLGLLAGLDRPNRGKIYIDGVELTALDEKELSDLRGRRMGFVFQSFQLLSTLTAIENVRVPMEILSMPEPGPAARSALERVGLAERAGHYPSQLSGGEMQRVAIARASVTRPDILLCDEPTGNLDSANGEKIMKLLQELNRECTLVLVTHNPELAALADREIRLRDGRIDSIISPRANGKKSGLRAVSKKALKKTGKKVNKKKGTGKLKKRASK